LTAKAYADLLDISPTHLNRVVRAATGMTVHDRIMLRVIEEARRALVFTSSSVQDIANHLGFSDSAYFSRCFRQRAGQTPSSYRSLERARLLQQGG
jgi:AraC family transcriptional activator of pobA